MWECELESRERSWWTEGSFVTTKSPFGEGPVGRGITAFDKNTVIPRRMKTMCCMTEYSIIENISVKR